MARKNYSEEFRLQAVDMYESNPVAMVRGIAEDLGIQRGERHGSDSALVALLDDTGSCSTQELTVPAGELLRRLGDRIRLLVGPRASGTRRSATASSSGAGRRSSTRSRSGADSVVRAVA